MLNDLFGEHLAHIGSARRVSDHCSAAADKCYGLIARHLQTLHKAKRHKVTDMKAVSRWIETDIENSLSAVYKLSYLLFVSNLRDQASRD